MPIPKSNPAPGETFDPSQEAPPFGHPLKQYFALNDDYINLNNGAYGSTPLPVMYETNQHAYRIESNPDKYIRHKVRPLLREARASLAKLVGAETDEVVLVPNATTAANVILRAFEWRDGDLIISATTTDGGVLATIQYLADRSEGPRPTHVKIPLNFPLTHAQIIDIYRTKLREIRQEYANTQFTDVPPLSPGYAEDSAARQNKIVVVIDTIVSNPGALLPWKELVQIAIEEGVWSVVDAAHSIGQESGIDLGETKPDFWFTNLHKWFFVKRACAILYTPKRNQHVIKSSVPTGWEYVSPQSPRYKEKGTNYVTQHEWIATSDVSNYLAIPTALAFRKWLGGEEAINEYCRKTALAGAKKLVEILGTRDLDVSREITLNMPNVQLPLPVESTPGEIYTPEARDAIKLFIRDRLLDDWNVYAANFYHNGAWWIRASTQVYNEVSDFERLGEALKVISKQVKERFLAKAEGGVA